jgi:phosphoribosylformimino-5-aminoimidazole carboxamide ribotide isomerase
MLIPSIDLQGGKIVQLVQGERLAIETDDVDAWVNRFAGYSKVQLIDLDAAKATGNNAHLVARVCSSLPCRVGGGIRSIERAAETFALGAKKVILGSALFRNQQVDIDFAKRLADRFGPERLIAAVDGKSGKVVIHGWRTSLDLSPADAMQLLEPFFGEFLYTHVDLEGLMRGTDIEAIRGLRAKTTRALTAAGGITTREEIAQLDGMNVDAVVGMALYTGKLKVD